MATVLAIGYRVPNPAPRPADARADRLADRPPIPQAVIDWPVGTGDPATDIAGPRGFARVPTPSLKRPMALPAALFEAFVVALMFVGVVVTLAFRVASVLGPADTTPKVATVETRIVSLVPVALPERVAQRVETR